MGYGFDKRAALIRVARPVGVVAQLVEHHNGIVGVRGSNPLGSTTATQGRTCRLVSSALGALRSTGAFWHQADLARSVLKRVA
jgi:hypothetical protein